MAITMKRNALSHEVDSGPPVQGLAKPSVSGVFQVRPGEADLRSPPASTKFPNSVGATSTPSEITNENHARELPSASHLAAAWDRQKLSKKRSQYYAEVYAYREPHNTARDRVTRDSVIVAEIKLSCELEEGQALLSDISFQLSEIYQRPESCITVSMCTLPAMLFGGSSEPAYFMTITALSSEIAPTKNKRSTALVQGFMHESLDIPPRRGIIRFESVLEENLATNGMTALQEIEELVRHSSEDSRALRNISRNKGRKSKRPSPPFGTENGRTSTPHIMAHERTKPGSNDCAELSDTGISEKKQMKRRKSFMAFFGR